MRALLVQAATCVGCMLIVAVAMTHLGRALLTDPGTSGTPPPPYTDPQLTITNALGGVGRLQGWSKIIGIATTKDLLADANIPTDIQADVESPIVTTATRFVTVTLTCGSGTGCAVAAGDGVCARLGPDTDSPALTCTAPTISAHTSPHSNGGCYLTTLGQSCTFTIRPIASCTSYATCHQPLWALAVGNATLVSTSVAW